MRLVKGIRGILGGLDVRARARCRLIPFPSLPKNVNANAPPLTPMPMENAKGLTVLMTPSVPPAAAPAATVK